MIVLSDNAVNLIETGRNGEIRGSVPPRVKNHNAFLFQVGTCSSL